MRLGYDSAHSLLEANRASIEAVERQTHTYGATDHHKLDVYTPPTAPGDAQTPPILVFFYGGGFTRGARLVPPANLVHANVGAFFAHRGILAVVADYRLLPHVAFPGGSEDVRDALLWVVANLRATADGSRVFVLAHSSGGTHLAGALLQPALFPAPLAQAVRGVAFAGVPFEIQPGKPAGFWDAAQAYYGSAKKVAEHHPLGLLRRADPAYVAGLPPVRVLMAAGEPRRVKSSGKTFAELYARKGGAIESFVLDGHDHVSPILMLSSGSGEEWAEEVAAWVLAV